MAKPRVGDLVEIQTSSGFAYALYTHEHKLFGSLLRVYGRTFSQRPSHFDALVMEKPQFETFFPLQAAVRNGNVAIAATVEIPARLRSYPIFRDGVADPKTGKISNWWLWDGEKEWCIGALSDEEKKYPIREVINDTLLRERIESGWTSLNDI